MNLDINVEHLNDLVDRAVHIVRSFRPPPSVMPLSASPDLPDPASLPSSGVTSDGDASLLLSEHALGNGLLESDSKEPQQQLQHPAGGSEGENALDQRMPAEATVSLSAASGEALVQSGKHVTSGLPPHSHAAGSKEANHGGFHEVEAEAGLKPWIKSSSMEHGLRAPFRSMLQPTADGRMSTRPLAHVHGSISTRPATSFKAPKSRLIRKQRA